MVRLRRQPWADSSWLQRWAMKQSINWITVSFRNNSQKKLILVSFLKRNSEMWNNCFETLVSVPISGWLIYRTNHEIMFKVERRLKFSYSEYLYEFRSWHLIQMIKKLTVLDPQSSILKSRSLKSRQKIRI